MEWIIIIVVLIWFLVAVSKKANEGNSCSSQRRSNSSRTDSVSKSYTCSSNYIDSDDHIRIVGGFYRSFDAKKFIKTLSTNDVVYFLPEPSNPYDCNAVMVLSSSGLHIGYIPRFLAKGVKDELKRKDIEGHVTCSAMSTYEFYVEIIPLESIERRDKTIEIYTKQQFELKKQVEEQKKREALDYYNIIDKADMWYDMKQYDKVENAIKPFFDASIAGKKCYELMIKLCHLSRKYEEEEKLIDEYLIMNEHADRSFWRRRKYHILREMGVIVSNEQIENEKAGIETTVLELDAFIIVVNLLATVINPDRIDFRDGQTLFAINLDGNIRKPICKLYLNNPSKMYLGIIGFNRSITKMPLESIMDIKRYEKHLKDTVRSYFEYNIISY